MNKQLRNILGLMLPLLAMMLVSACVEDDDYIDTHPRLAQIMPERGVPGTLVRVSGRNLAGINSVLVGDVVASIEKVTADSVYFTVPAEAEVGSQQLRFSSPQGIAVLDFEVQGAVAMPSYVVFNDALNPDWEVWGGWGGAAHKVGNNPMEGAGTNNLEVSWEDPWGGFQLHPKTPNPFVLSGFSRLMISIRGGEGMAGREVFVFIKDTGGVEGAKFKIVLEEAYVSYSIPLSELGSPADINELNFQNADAGTVIYVDAYGLD